MYNSTLLKQEFLKKWIKGLHLYTNLNKGRGNTSISDRKKAIKLSADAAIASTREGATQWSQALMNDVVSSADGTNKILVERIIGHKLVSDITQAYSSVGLIITCSKGILRRSRVVSARRKARRVVPRRVRSSSDIARKILRNKTCLLKSLVPGGENMDDRCLIQETLDYIASLRVQVDVMRFLANTAQRLET